MQLQNIQFGIESWNTIGLLKCTRYVEGTLTFMYS